MNNRITAHVDALFTGNTKSANFSDIKEELLSNLFDKYDDLIAQGKSEDEAYALVISGIGDIGSMLDELGETPEYRPVDIAKNQEKRGIFISIAIALYIISLVPVIIVGDDVGLVAMMSLCAIATALIIYGNNIGKIGYIKSNDSFVEIYKEKIAVNSDKIRLRNALASSMWSMIVVLYLASSFIFGNWAWSWIIFLIGACFQQVITYKFAPAEKRQNLWHGIFWTLTVVLYFVLSFALDSWAWSWIIFLIAVAVQQIIRLLVILNKTE